jgi:dinuclear metal center YbgI/SA1388 family protein
MLTRVQLVSSLDNLLNTKNFKDYGPNGLQVEGKEKIQKIVSGVTASEALIMAAIENKADAILVHHGLFWRGQDGTIKGWMKKRLALLLQHNINLIAYHLPLDGHETLGNNAQIGLQLSIPVESRFGEQNLGFMGSCSLSSSLELGQLVQEKISSQLTVVGPVVHALHGQALQVAWCSGGAQSYFEPAIANGAQVFITGEISEPQMHYANEMGVCFMACGHHASEKFGVQAVGQWLSQNYKIDHQFIDIFNPA